MQLFFFDTETTSFNWDIIQFWAIYGKYVAETKTFHEERIINQFINTDKSIDPWAFAVHWITKEQLKPFKKMDWYIREILAYINKSDLIICHNVKFDLKMLKQEMKKYEYPTEMIDSKKTFCTMDETKEAMWVEKRMKLWEMYKQLFWKEFDNAHDAMADIRATKDCFLELYHKKLINLSL